MKKALFVTTVSGFVPQFEMQDVHLLQDLGYEVHYASNFKNPVYACDRQALEAQGLRLHDLGIEKSPLQVGKNLQSIRYLRQIIDDEEIDMIHCHTPMGGVVARVAAHASKKDPYVIYTAHGFHFYKGAALWNCLSYYPAEKFLAKWTDVLITINREDCQRARQSFHLKKNGMVKQIHGVGLNGKRFCVDPAKGAEKRNELGIPEDAFHIVTCAELNENKNQRVILEAIANIKRSDIYYSLCGDGPMAESLQEWIRQRHLEKQVQLLGYRTDVEDILQTADIFAFSSIREGLGMAAIEALACGIPVVAAANRGTREYIKHGINGLLCEAKDEEAFRLAIEKLYMDRAYCKKMAKQCRASVEKFDIEFVAQTMNDIYRHADERITQQKREQ